MPVLTSERLLRPSTSCFRIPTIWMIVPVAIIIVALQFWGSYKPISRIFKWLTLTLFAYIGAAILAHPPWREYSRPPSFRNSISVANTFSPLWLSWAQPSRLISFSGNPARKWKRRSRWDHNREEREAQPTRNCIGRFGIQTSECFSVNLVFYFVILAAASTLHVAGKTDIQSATDAAQALRPLAGNASTILFALGLIGAGFLAVPVLTGASAYAVSRNL